MKQTIYLSGPMDNCNEYQMRGWREELKTALCDQYDFLDPCTGKAGMLGVVNPDRPKMTPQIAADIVKFDKADVDAADITFAYVWKPSHGTSMEILYAWEQGKTVVSVAPATLSPWVQHHSHFTLPKIEDAVFLLKEHGVPVQERYCLGFMFQGDYVTVVRKARPTWQAGLLNGLGGKVKNGENSLEAMCREFHEECAYITHPTEWKHFATMHRRWGRLSGKGPYTCDVFAANARPGARFITGADEAVTVIPWKDWQKYATVHNFGWLVEMALSSLHRLDVPVYRLSHDDL